MDTSQEIDGSRRRKRSKRRDAASEDEREPRSGAIAALRRFLSRYWFEWTAALLFGVGMFLLLENLQIKEVIYRVVVVVASEIRDHSRNAWRGTMAFLGRFETSDLVGIILILIAAVMAVRGMRARAISRSAPLIDGSLCPKCGSAIRRTRHKSFGQRLQQMILRIRIRVYACRKCSYRDSVWEDRRR